MAKKLKKEVEEVKSPTQQEEEKLIKEVQAHYQDWTDDMYQRMTRKNGWNDVTDAFWGKLPDDWPYISRVTDPRIRTTIIEKNSRLLNSKLRGKLVPREGADVVSAAINNAILDFQWDAANEGGSMLTKLSIADQDTRLYGSKFALVYWKEKQNDDGELSYCGNDIKPLDIRDCGMDFAATHIRDAKWFQVREWRYLEDLENEMLDGQEPIFKNVDKLKRKMENGEIVTKNSRRDNEYVSRIKQLKGLEDRLGTDVAFPTVEIVTEYRKDKWITFSPEYNVILRMIDNPYKHGKIPVAQLRYYPLQDDPIGESEVESVMSLWKAIQATVCGYMDEVILKMRPPLKIIEGAARIETIVYGPEAQWLVSNPDAVTEARSNGEAVRFFQTTYSALISAFNTAMGDASQGVSNVDPFGGNKEKTATEVRYTAKQQNSRDQKNQTDLSEFLKDIMMMWLANNKQFLFRDPKKKNILLKIVGKDNFDLFKQAGLDAMQDTDEGMQQISDIVSTQDGNLSDNDLMEMQIAGQIPKYPVGGEMQPKMTVNETGDVADLYVEPEDLDGVFDYIPDVKSMSIGASEELTLARQRAIQSFTSPVILQSLAQEGWRPKFKEIFSADLESSGLSGAERFFEKIQQPMGGINGQPTQPGQPGAIEAGVAASAGSPATQQLGGLPEISQATAGSAGPQQMAGPQLLPNV